jgi:sulfofructose kinase
LLSEGVITSLLTRGEQPTPLSSILVKPDGRRSVVTYRGSTENLPPDQVDIATFRPGAILFDGHEPTLSLSLALQARARKIPSVLDAGSVHRGTLELAPLCDYLVASEKFARDLSKNKNNSEALRHLARIAAVAVITLGDEGLVWASGNETGSLGAFPVQARDTTGAGDIFHGAFALRTARGEGFLAALRYASAAAALGCTKIGARPGIPVKEEVEAFLSRF